MNINEQPLVSVVTPFFNTEKYLEQCIVSVLSQTYDNFEYILVNNKSSDGSEKIARKYRDIDKRIKFFNNENFLSQVNNYNNSLKKISKKSKYFKIVQADDMLFQECISKMVSVAEMDSSIGIVSSYSLHGNKIINDGLPYSGYTFSGKEVGRASLLLDGRQIFGSPTTVMFQSELLKNNKSFFDEMALFEDTDVCYEILKSWNFGFVFQVLTFIRDDNEGFSSKISLYDPLWLLSKFIRLNKYGDFFLNPNEYEIRINDVKDAYYKFLANRYFTEHRKDFWEFHRNGLSTIGLSLNRSSLIKYIFFDILDIIFNPKATIGRMLK